MGPPGVTAPLDVLSSSEPEGPRPQELCAQCHPAPKWQNPDLRPEPWLHPWASLFFHTSLVRGLSLLPVSRSLRVPPSALQSVALHILWWEAPGQCGQPLGPEPSEISHVDVSPL